MKKALVKASMTDKFLLCFGHEPQQSIAIPGVFTLLGHDRHLHEGDGLFMSVDQYHYFDISTHSDMSAHLVFPGSPVMTFDISQPIELSRAASPMQRMVYACVLEAQHQTWTIQGVKIFVHSTLIHYPFLYSDASLLYGLIRTMFPSFLTLTISEQVRMLDKLSKRAGLPIIPHGIWSTLCLRGIVWVHQTKSQWIEQRMGRRTSHPIGVLLVKPKNLPFQHDLMPNFPSMWHDVAQLFNVTSLGQCDEAEVHDQSVMIKARFGSARLEAAQLYFRETKRIQQMALRLQQGEGVNARVMYAQHMNDIMKVATSLGYDAYTQHLTSIQSFMQRFLPSTMWMVMQPIEEGYVIALDETGILKQALTKLQRFFHEGRVLLLTQS